MKIANLYGLTSKTVQVSAAFPLVDNYPLLSASFAKLKLSSLKLGQLIQTFERGSLLTPDVTAADKDVNLYFDDFKRRLTVAVKSSDPITADAAKPLDFVIKSYWDITSRRLVTQMEKMVLMFQNVDSSSTLVADLATLHLSDLWAKLKQVASILQTVYDQREVEIKARSKAPSTMQNEVVLDYDRFCDIVYKAVETTPSDDFIALFEAVDQVRHRFSMNAKKKLKHHLSADDIPDQKYTGDYLTPIATGVCYLEDDHEPVKLFPGKDFINTYEDNVEEGTGRIFFHGKGKYSGKVFLTFSIVKS